MSSRRLKADAMRPDWELEVIQRIQVALHNTRSLHREYRDMKKTVKKLKADMDCIRGRLEAVDGCRRAIMDVFHDEIVSRGGADAQS